MASGARIVSATLSAGAAPDAVVNFTETGLLANQAVNVAVTADTLASYACGTGAGLTSAPLPVTEQASTVGRFHARADGTLAATLTLRPPVPPGTLCPPGEQARPVRGRYSNAVVSDLTNLVRASATGSADSGV